MLESPLRELPESFGSRTALRSRSSWVYLVGFWTLPPLWVGNRQESRRHVQASTLLEYYFGLLGGFLKLSRRLGPYEGVVRRIVFARHAATPLIPQQWRGKRAD